MRGVKRLENRFMLSFLRAGRCERHASKHSVTGMFCACLCAGAHRGCVCRRAGLCRKPVRNACPRRGRDATLAFRIRHRAKALGS